MKHDARRYAPAAARNRKPIYKVLRPYLPRQGLILEIASGTGEHITYFAQASDPGLMFQPSDPDRSARDSIDAWTSALGLSSVLPAIALDATSAQWPVAAADVVLCINMIHIAPWAAAIGLIRGASRVLPRNGVLFIYAPFRRGGHHTAPSNQNFDQELRSKNPAWDLCDLDEVTALAAANGFGPPIVEQMRANNFSLIMRRLQCRVIG